MSIQRFRRVHRSKHVESLQSVAKASERLTPKTGTFEIKNRQRNRPEQLIEVLRELDHSQNPVHVARAIEEIRQLYRELMVGDLVGLFGRCYLGNPFIDHQVSITGGVLQHFSPNDEVPFPFSVARGVLKSTTAYEYVEVYSDGSLVPLYPTSEPVWKPGVYKFDPRS
ncbi:hypothetical protein [Corynebacterium resistens]|uniref:hypothetical protein n=1 Tax=Corynebacterium resistens TaxID=258224 RepID=UPI002354BA9A|nr:hypothetical protein [Corynebacterium resistens]